MVRYWRSAAWLSAPAVIGRRCGPRLESRRCTRRSRLRGTSRGLRKEDASLCSTRAQIRTSPKYVSSFRPTALERTRPRNTRAALVVTRARTVSSRQARVALVLKRTSSHPRIEREGVRSPHQHAPGPAPVPHQSPPGETASAHPRQPPAPHWARATQYTPSESFATGRQIHRPCPYPPCRLLYAEDRPYLPRVSATIKKVNAES